MAKIDYIVPEGHVRGVKNGALRRILSVSGDDVHWCDEFGKGVCTVQSIKNWMIDGPAKPTIAETDKIDHRLLDYAGRIDAQVYRLTQLLNREIERPKQTARAYRPPGWAKQLIAELSDREYADLCEAIEQSERVGVF
ncbi:MAG: hypothetical protein EOP83_24000 [Verrucomicrobiaceae bacterium]|nr:MAG: hypothetical protein EOP83_24000 [Verrucomicrobiaceae bacterium]